MSPLLADGTTLFSGLGSILQGLGELLAVIGAGVGFVVRSRKTSKREKLRTEAAATLAAKEMQRHLEERLEQQHKDAIKNYQHQIASLSNQIITEQKQHGKDLEDERATHATRIEALQAQNDALQRQVDRLMENILNRQGGKQ